jgi:hypothetical protein
VGEISLGECSDDYISPPPQRIILCFGQWQPSYFDMMRTIPEIEFNKGIPEDIDKGDYLDISQRNFIVLDDLIIIIINTLFKLLKIPSAMLLVLTGACIQYKHAS